MIATFNRRLTEFVDREAEMQRFCRMLESEDKAIMVVSGDSGIGKSSLLARMMHECASRKLRKAEVVWTDTRPHDYLSVMRKMREDLGTHAFVSFTDLVNFFTKEHYQLTVNVEGVKSIDVAREAKVTDASVGDIGGIIVKDCMLNLPRSDMAVPEAERILRLTDRFLSDLKAIADNERIVLFFDAVEKMSTDTENWLWGELLMPIREGLLTNVCAVVCGQREPVLDREWAFCIDITELQPLGVGHIAAYLDKRGVPGNQEIRLALAQMVFAATGGKVLQVAKLVDTYMAKESARNSAA